MRSPVVKRLEHYLAASDCDGPDLARAVSGLRCVIRYEHLQGDFDHACDVLGLPRSALPHRNRGLRNAYAEYYCGEARRVVADRCASEIQLFGYEFEG